MIDALTEPYVLFGLGTCLLMIVLVFVADYQESKTPPPNNPNRHAREFSASETTQNPGAISSITILATTQCRTVTYQAKKG